MSGFVPSQATREGASKAQTDDVSRTANMTENDMDTDIPASEDTSKQDHERQGETSTSIAHALVTEEHEGDSTEATIPPSPGHKLSLTIDTDALRSVQEDGNDGEDAVEVGSTGSSSDDHGHKNPKPLRDPSFHHLTCPIDSAVYMMESP